MQSQNGHRPAVLPSSVAGVTVARVEMPDSAAAVAGLLADAANLGHAVIPVGGATQLGIGNPPGRADLVISTRALKRVLVHEPDDMTLSVEAGATLQDVQDVLAGHGQALPIEVPSPSRATIGGILATALYGPKRLGWGTLRDYLIGISVAYPDRTVAKAGGLVVKNVSGFDLMRMHHGALGTLGVIISANFKVLPAPRSERTVLIDTVENPDHLTAIRDAALRWRGRPAAFEVLSRNGARSVAIRIDGRARTTQLLASELVERLPLPASVLDPDASRSYWADYVAGFDASDSPQSWWIRSRVLPAQTLPLFQRLSGNREAESLEINASPGLGFVDIRGKETHDLSAWTETLRQIAPRSSVITARPDQRLGIDAWGASIDSVDLMKQLKREFDPGDVLNPGRFVGGL